MHRDPLSFPSLPTPAATVAASVALLPGLAGAQSHAPGAPELPPGANAGDIFSQAFFLSLGFSFLVGLAAGYALKIAFRIALLVIGVILLGVFGLQYVGLVEVNWSGVEVQYDSFAEWLKVQGGEFLAFMGRNLTSGASFLAGLVVGLRL